jgi:hypothetical protein
MESADLQGRMIYERTLARMCKGNMPTLIDKVNKTIRKQTSKGGVQERVDAGNVIVMGAELEYNTLEDTIGLSDAFEDAKYDKHKNRLDDGSTDIDSLDSFEYSILEDFMLELEEAILYNL